MSNFQLPGGSRPASQRPAWSSLALVVEAMLLTLFLVASLSILTGLFSAAAGRATEGRELAQAVSLATSAAEQFAASPADVAGTTEEDGLTVTCEVEEEPTAAGTLYRATITVLTEDGDEPVYVLETSRYESGVDA